MKELTDLERAVRRLIRAQYRLVTPWNVPMAERGMLVLDVIDAENDVYEAAGGFRDLEKSAIALKLAKPSERTRKPMMSESTVKVQKPSKAPRVEKVQDVQPKPEEKKKSKGFFS